VGADAEALSCEAVDGRVRLLLRHVVARQEHVQRLEETACDITQVTVLLNNMTG